ncbi:unnamed protein product [Fusarium venenatum]|uniref:Uncharacterized protein n=1 Tax=Fusarium venenatum TaxID=56646 RepID=A0A2L2SQ57_9HYPO|nr:uncharacterized protein FVRRES_11512 [Fusarium venenatum]CEI38821.1 unnamed protein product [Fusarium venenatum]
MLISTRRCLATRRKKNEKKKTKERGDTTHAAVQEPDLVYAEPEQACSRDMTVQNRTSTPSDRSHEQKWLEAKGFRRLRRTPRRINIALRCRMRTNGGRAEFVDLVTIAT